MRKLGGVNNTVRDLKALVEGETRRDFRYSRVPDVQGDLRVKVAIDDLWEDN
jgi:hypothetical protein